MKKLFKIIIMSVFMAAFIFSVKSVAASEVLTSAEAPKINYVKIDKKALNVHWKSFKGALKYEVWKKNSKGEWVRKGYVKKPVYCDENVKNGKTYTYRVRAILSGNKKSAYLVKSAVFLSAPKVTSAWNVSDGVRVKWNKMQSAEGFYIYRQLKGSSSWKKIATVKGDKTEFTDKSAKGCTWYVYKVRQYASGSMSTAGNGVVGAFVPAVKNLVSKNSPKGVTVSWSKVADAKGYMLWRKSGENGKWKQIAKIKGFQNTGYIDKTVLYGSKNEYKIKAFLNDKRISDYSSVSFVYGVDPSKPMVALTYDDGPYAPATNRILNKLKEYNARATFFVVGSRLDTYADCVKRAASSGNEIANHTYTHSSLTALSPADIKKQIDDTDKLIFKYSGTTTKLVRAPGGAVNDKVKANVKYPLINWSVDTYDWNHRTASKTVAAIKNYVRDGSVVLMHDLYIPTAAASETIIPWLVSKGYQLVTVSEMMDAKGIKITKGNLYTKAY